VRRGIKREVISRTYNRLLRLALGVRFSDAQCGFKALHGDVARRLLPRVEDRSWFFDTELLVLAERAGMRIREVPVEWTDDPDSRVDLVPTIIEDLRGMWRLRRSMAPRTQGLPTHGGLVHAHQRGGAPRAQHEPIKDIRVLNWAAGHTRPPSP
jgi:hypothetical protein